MSDAERGLYGKYRVERRDGSSEPGGKHAACEYFVLDLVHDKLALGALETYAKSAEREFPLLADDLYDKLAKLNPYRTCVPPYVKGGSECHEPGVIPLANGCLFCVAHAQEHERRWKLSSAATEIPSAFSDYARGAIERRIAGSK